jgi:hypothetical protein
MRLYSDQVDEIKLLQDSILKLGNSEINEINISELPISRSNLKLIFKVCKSDSGVTVNKNMREYIVSLSNESYLEMVEKLNPLIDNQNGFTWLHESRTFYILFTTDGYW